MLRLLIDENVDHRILRGLRLRLPQVDYVVVSQVGMSGLPDVKLLKWAAEENRIMVTHDRKTMIRDAQHRVKRGEPMPGVIFVPREMAIGRAIEDLELMLECYSPDELTDQIKYLPL